MPPPLSPNTGCFGPMSEPSVRHAVVTGAGGAIGSAIVARLVARGATAFGVHRPANPVARASEPSRQGVLVSADLADPSSRERLGSVLLDQLNELDLLVHCAGIYVRSPIAELSASALAHELEVNLVGPMHLTRLLLPALERAGGQVVFVNSSVVQRPPAMLAGYAASKAGLRAAADSLRDEVNGLGIRVLSVYPGRTEGPLQQSIHAAEGRAYDRSRLLAADDVARAIMNAVEMPVGAEITDLFMRPMRPPR
jgi:NADP-dependent 3-hydroxy acid dehydrogenase YdfG